MGNDLMPVIITIAVASLIIVGSNIATFVILLNHLGGRIDQSEARGYAGGNERQGGIARNHTRLRTAADGNHAV